MKSVEELAYQYSIELIKTCETQEQKIEAIKEAWILANTFVVQSHLQQITGVLDENPILNPLASLSR